MWSVIRRGGGAITKNLASPTSIFTRHFSSSNSNHNNSLLSLDEVQKILKDVGADDVKVFPAPERFEYADFMVIATGRSAWHVRNISQALIYQVKEKQRGAKRMLLPAVVGEEGGKWVVIDSGSLIIHAVDEKARAYYNLENLWTTNTSSIIEPTQELQNAFVKIRKKNNSKKHSQTRS